MKSVLILTGSARPNSASTNVARLVEAEVAKRDDAKANVVEVASLNLPFYNEPTAPSAEDHKMHDENAIAWSKMVTEADAVVWAMPEYNHSISAIQKNAIDWLAKEWSEKPLMVVGYGWYEGANILEAVKLPFKTLKPDVRAEVGLGFAKQINPDGTVAEQSQVDDKLAPAVDALLK